MGQPRVLLSVLLLAPCFAAAEPVSLRFNPRPGLQYSFHVARQDTAGSLVLLSKDYDAVLRFARNGRRHAMTGRTLHGKFSGTHTWDKDNRARAAQIDQTRVSAHYDLAGRLLDKFKQDPPRSQMVATEALPGELTGYSFMNLSYPKTAVEVGTTWVATLNGEDYFPSGEMTQTQPGQTVRKTYKVERIYWSGSRELISVVSHVDTAVGRYTWPISHAFSVHIKTADRFTLDLADGLIVEGRFEWEDSDPDSPDINRRVIVITRL